MKPPINKNYTTKLKVGDKVICIKHCGNDRTEFIKNKICTVTGVFKFEYEIDYYNFSIISKTNHYNFDDYFIALKEIRKQKLDKLNSLCANHINLK